MHYLKAHKIFDGEQFLSPEALLVVDHDGVLHDILLEPVGDTGNVEVLEGIITPGFVNAHCHLELSHLKGVIPKRSGFCGFASRLMQTRDRFSDVEVREAMMHADEQMYRNGVIAVGDISNKSASFAVKSRSKIHYHTFLELIALHPGMAEPVLASGLTLLHDLHGFGLHGSLAPHAPYSVSNELMHMIAQDCIHKNLPFTIHNQESLEETRFFMGEESQMYELYAGLNLDISWWRPPGTSSLASYIRATNGTRRMLVHSTFTTSADVELASHEDNFWCFCPSANLYIEDRLPDFSLFADQPARLCVGTDSLASNDHLDMLGELNLVAGATSLLSEEDLLSMICLNGARALGMEDKCGRLMKGVNAGLNLIRRNGNRFEWIKKIN